MHMKDNLHQDKMHFYHNKEPTRISVLDRKTKLLSDKRVENIYRLGPRSLLRSDNWGEAPFVSVGLTSHTNSAFVEYWKNEKYSD